MGDSHGYSLRFCHFNQTDFILNPSLMLVTVLAKFSSNSQSVLLKLVSVVQCKSLQCNRIFESRCWMSLHSNSVCSLTITRKNSLSNKILFFHIITYPPISMNSFTSSSWHYFMCDTWDSTKISSETTCTSLTLILITKENNSGNWSMLSDFKHFIRAGHLP